MTSRSNNKADADTPAPAFYIYILTSQTRVLYIGMTSDIHRRVYEHKTKTFEGFTAKYNVNQLVYYEQVNDMETAIKRELQLKGWTRAKKISLVEKMNSRWLDLSDRWYETDLAASVFSMAEVQTRFGPDPSTSASTPALRIRN